MAVEEIGLRLTLKGRRETAKALQDTAKDVDKVGDRLAEVDADGRKAAAGIRRAELAGERFGRVVGRGVGGVLRAVTSLKGALAGGAVLFAAKQTVGLAVNLEALGNKAATVFGDQLGVVQTWAKQSANNMGLTSSEAIGLAANFADLLIPMGFARDTAAKMSTDVVGLSGALAQWSGGKVSAAEASEVLAKAMLGERDGLKALGISISETDVQARLAAKGQEKLTGQALEQAKALATSELIFEKSTDAQAAFAGGANKLGMTIEKTKARFRELRDRGVIALTPTLLRAADKAQVLMDEFERGEGTGGRLRTKLEELRDGAVKLWDEFRTGEGTGGQVRGALEGVATAAETVGVLLRDTVVPALSWINDHPDAIGPLVTGMAAMAVSAKAIAAANVLTALLELGGAPGMAAAAGAAGGAGAAGAGGTAAGAGAAAGGAAGAAKGAKSLLGRAGRAAGVAGLAYAAAGAAYEGITNPRPLTVEELRPKSLPPLPTQKRAPVRQLLVPSAIEGGTGRTMSGPETIVINMRAPDGSVLTREVVKTARRRRDLE